jgi:uncharacterized protein (DUF885 family)
VKRLITLLFAALTLSATTAATSESGAKSVDDLAARYWQYELQTDYNLRSQLGLPVETIRPVGLAAADADASAAQSVLDGLAQVDPSRLDHDRWLTYRSLSFLASSAVESRKFFWLAQQATPYAGGLQLGAITSLLTTFGFANPGDAQRYLSLLLQYAEYVRSVRSFLEGQHARGIILPNVESNAAEAVFEGYAAPPQSGLLVPDDTRLGAIAATDRSALKTQAAAMVSSEVVPAFKSVAEYLAGAYRIGAPAGVGLSQYPGGREYYQHLILAYTTLTITPEALHARGLEEVARLNVELDGIRREVGFAGTVAQFKQHLTQDPRFFPKTPQQFGDRLELYVGRAQAAVPAFFAHTPTAPYGVASLPEALAGSQTFGYYDQPKAARPKGIYYYNAWHPARTSMLGAGALICHELIPGHHFQIALQQENTALPDVRRYDFSEAGFVEGWGEYASQLCWDMGVYQTPYDKAGRIMQDLMVSTRLVVDTGMNALGWSRERAMDFMRKNLTLSDAQIATESLRYSTDIPGQALAYKTGELTMLQIRKQTRERLGSAFDIRRFHGWVIDSGTMTLDTLRAHVEYEITHPSG